MTLDTQARTAGIDGLDDTIAALVAFRDETYSQWPDAIPYTVLLTHVTWWLNTAKKLVAGVELLRELHSTEACANYRNGFNGYDHVQRVIEQNGIDVNKPCHALTYHPETGMYRRCLHCRVGDFLRELSQ